MAAHRLFFHITWSTIDRRPMIDASTAAFLDEFFRRAAIRERARIVRLAILSTHVHVIVQTPPRFDLGHLVQVLKGGSSYAVNRLPGNVRGLRWTREYSATTVRVGPPYPCASGAVSFGAHASACRPAGGR
jgi:REP element-mobilizing transposase RayT